MTNFASLPPAEQARQLANPEGHVGIEVAEWMNGNNRESNAQILSMLDIHAGNRVLEIGFGNGRAAANILERTKDVQYSGIDISATMVEEAIRLNAELVASGHVHFSRASAERMPFADESFDRVLSIAVMHFWHDPLASFGEIYRVMRPGAVAILSSLDPQTRPSFAQPEFGFHLRTSSEWAALGRQFNFQTVDTQSVETEQRTPDGKLTKRLSLRLTLKR